MDVYLAATDTECPATFIPSQKCHMNIILILSGYGGTGRNQRTERHTITEVPVYPL